MSRGRKRAEREAAPQFYLEGASNVLDGLRWRQHRRIPVILPAKLETSRGCFDTVILDLSLGGARGWLNEPIGLQEDTALDLVKFGRLPADILSVTRQKNRRFEFRLRFKLDPRAVGQQLSGLSFSLHSFCEGRVEMREPEGTSSVGMLPAQIWVH